MSSDGKKADETRPATPGAIVKNTPADPAAQARGTREYVADASKLFGDTSRDDSVQLSITPAGVDPRAIAVTAASIPSNSIAGQTTPGTGATHCPVCGTLVHDAPECDSCGYIFDDPRLGQVIAERYRVDALLGVGGFGRVYRATHLTLGESVAIKFLLAEWSNRPESRARFKREAVALARLRHPSIVGVYDYGEHLDELYMVMELVRGTQLYDCIKPNDTLMPIERCCKIMDEVLSVLFAAHEMGIVHRDLKAENVMLLTGSDGVERVKVLDFGLALMDDRPASDRLTATTTIQGTPLYMSPEQCKGRDVTSATDIYAAGIMLYEMLSGSTPFEAASMPEIMARHMFVEPPPIADWGLKRAVPPGIEAVVRRALAKNAEDRPTASEFRELLHIALAGDDETSIKAKQAQVRAEHAALTRDQRALVDASAQRSTTVAPLPTAEDGTMPRALLWGFEESRTEALRGPLAVHGVNGVLYRKDAPPDAEMLAKRPTKAIVLSGATGADVVERVKLLREHPPTAKLPILVAELTDSSLTPALIRAGASDVAPKTILDETLCKQIAKLIRRGR